MVERGEITSIYELAKQQDVDPSLIGHNLRLATLALDITQAILTGQEPYRRSIRQRIIWRVKKLAAHIEFQKSAHGE